MGMTPLSCAKLAAVLSVFYSGMNVYQLIAKLEDVRARARQFQAVAGNEANVARLRLVRAFFYLGAPLLYLGALLGAGLPPLFLLTAATKFWVSALLGLATERRLLRGGEYRPRDHLLSRLDAGINLFLAAGALRLLLRLRY